jgi:hypothetical protein
MRRIAVSGRVDPLRRADFEVVLLSALGTAVSMRHYERNHALVVRQVVGRLLGLWRVN